MILYKTFEVSGVTHHVDDFFQALAVENSDYTLSKKEIAEEFLDGDKIYKYDFIVKKAELVPEPDNPYDPNAIRVEADGHLIGYIKKNETAKVKELLAAEDFLKVQIEIAGGDYKLVSEDDDEKITVEECSCGYFADITIQTGTKEETAQAPAESVEDKAPAVSSAAGGLSILLIILSVVLILASLLILLVLPPLGLIFLVGGVILLILGLKQRKKYKRVNK